MFDGRYVVDDFALILKALFLLAAYVVVLMSQTELEEGGYYQGEFYVLLLVSVLGMVMMTSSRDLVSVFIALELLSIPAYMMAAWRKRDGKSNEAGVKYYLLGVFASAVLLYGMSCCTAPPARPSSTDIGQRCGDARPIGAEVVAVAFVIVASASRSRPCRSTPGRPTPTRGRRRRSPRSCRSPPRRPASSPSCSLIFLAFPEADDVYGPLIWVLSALTMTVGNVLALRQTNIVRMLAYSSVSQGGFILMPLAFVGDRRRRPSGAERRGHLPARSTRSTNLGAFAVVIAVSRKTRSGEISSFGGLIRYARAWPC